MIRHKGCSADLMAGGEDDTERVRAEQKDGRRLGDRLRDRPGQEQVGEMVVLMVFASPRDPLLCANILRDFSRKLSVMLDADGSKFWTASGPGYGLAPGFGPSYAGRRAQDKPLGP